MDGTGSRPTTDDTWSDHIALQSDPEARERGESNSVTRIMGIGPSHAADVNRTTEVIAEQLFGQRKADLVLTEVRNHIALAEDAIHPITLPATGRYLAAQKGIVDDLEGIFPDRNRAELAEHLFESAGLDSLLRSVMTPVW